MTGQHVAAVGDRSACSSSSMPARQHDLVLDPDNIAMQLRLVLMRLDVLGCEVKGVSSGQRALEAAVSQIHTDIEQLPGRLGEHASVVGDDDAHTSQWSKSFLKQCSALQPVRDIHSLGAQQGMADSGGDNEDSKQNEDCMMTKIHARSELAAYCFDSEPRYVKLSAPAFFFGHDKTEAFLEPRQFVQPLHPDSWRRANFDIMAMIVLLAESIWIPYQLSWDIKLEGALLVLSVLAAGFWMLDLVLGFVTGYRNKNDHLVMTFRSIACHYLSTTFWANLLVVVVDITSIVLDFNWSAHSDGATFTPLSVKFARVLKAIRLLRIEALFRTGSVAVLSAHVATFLRKLGLDEQFNFAVWMMKFFFVIIWVNHFGCCIWHGIGHTANAKWEKDYPDTADWPYLTGFYLSTSAMIAGGAVIMPTTALELVVTTAFLLFGFIFCSILISWLISEVMDYGVANRERTSNLKTLRQFLCQHTVDSTLSMPIEKQANVRMASVRRLSEKDVNALTLISPTLRVELWAAMYGPSVSMNPFMRICNILVPSFIKDLCFCAISHEAEESGKVIFETDSKAVGARIVYWGSLVYHPRCTQVQKTGPTIQVVKGDWISEVALWAHWHYHGWLEASTPCELLTLRADAFLKIIVGHPDSLARIAYEYSSALLKATEEESQLGIVNDLNLPVQHESIVAAMPLQARVGMSRAALQILDRQKHWNARLAKNASQDLQCEIDTGECDMYVDEKERVQRVVTIVALRLEKQDGSIVVQIGKCQRGESSARCTLPGTKIKIGELPRDAIDRLVNTRLRPYKDGLVWGQIDVDQEERISKTFGLKSKYQRTVFHAELQPDFVPVENNLLQKEQELVVTESPSRVSIGGIIQSDRRAFTLGNMQTIDSTFVFAWLKPDDHFLLQNHDESDKILKRWISEVDLSEVETLSKSVSRSRISNESTSACFEFSSLPEYPVSLVRQCHTSI